MNTNRMLSPMMICIAAFLIASVSVSPSSADKYPTPKLPPRLRNENSVFLFGALVLSNGTVGYPHIYMECDGENSDVVLSGYALSIYGDAHPTTKPIIKGKKMGSPPFPMKKNRSPKSVVSNPDTTTANYNVYQGFMGSPSEVLSTIQSNDGGIFNGVSIASQADFYDPFGQFVKEDGSVDVASIDWSRVLTTVVVAANVSQLPINITIPTIATGQQVFDSAQGITVYSATVAYGIADGDGPHYVAEVDPTTLDVHLTIDEDWYAGVNAAKQRSQKLSKLHAGRTKHKVAKGGLTKSQARSTASNDTQPSGTTDGSLPAQQGSDDNSDQSGSSYSTENPFGAGIIVVSLQMGFEKSTDAVEADASPETGQTVVHIVPFSTGSNNTNGTNNNDTLGSTPDISSSDSGIEQLWLMSSSIPVSTLFPEQQRIITGESDDETPAGLEKPIIDTVILILLLMCVCISVGYDLGTPFEFESIYAKKMYETEESLRRKDVAAFSNETSRAAQSSPNLTTPLLPTSSAKHRYGPNGKAVQVYPDVLPITMRK